MSLMQILGPAAVPTIICLVVGLALLVLEMFTPGVGVPGVTGLLCLIAVVIMQLGWGSPKIGILIVAIVLVLLVLMLLWFIRSFQKGRLSRSFLVLHDSIEGSSSSVSHEAASIVGLHGKAITALRPAGTAEIEGKRMSVTTTGAFIPAGKSIEVVSASGLDVLVKAAEE